MKRVLRIVWVVVAIINGPCFGGTPQQLVPLVGAPFDAEVVGVSDGKISLRVVGQPTADQPVETGLPLAKIMRWGNPTSPRPQPVVVFADGGLLVAAAQWSQGAAIRLAGGQVTVVSDTFGETWLPKKALRGVVFAQLKPAAQREQLISQLGQETAAEDVVRLTNGDHVTGQVVAIEQGALKVTTKAGDISLPLARIEAIAFARNQSTNTAENRTNSDQSSENSDGMAKIAAGMRDGSLLYADSLEAAAGKLAIKCGDGITLYSDAVEDLTTLQVWSKEFDYLSDLTAANYRSVPYLNIEWPLARDRNVLGGPLMVGGKRYLKGLGLHSAARVTYKLDGEYRQFAATIAIDDAAGDRGSVVCGVYVERDGKWAEAFKSGTIRGGEAPLPVEVDLRGARGVTLTVDFADRGDELDYADWLDARLVR